VDDTGKPVLGEIHGKGLVQKSPAASTVELSLQTGRDTRRLPDRPRSSTARLRQGRQRPTWAEIADDDETWSDSIAQRDPSVLLVMFAASKDLKQIGQQRSTVSPPRLRRHVHGRPVRPARIANKAVLSGLKNVYARPTRPRP
jgi:hypothetical protein